MFSFKGAHRFNIFNRIKIDNNWESLNKVCKNGSLWISASELGNYLLSEPLLDWFKMYRHRPITRRGCATTNVLFDCGNKFEAEICKILESRFETITISDSSDHNRCSDENAVKTMKAMCKGVPIILQGVLRDHESRLQGIPDILIRSDYLSKLVDELDFEHEEVCKKAPGLNKRRRYHYIVIDIKWSALSLCSNGINIRNEGRVRAYKGQLAVYNYLLGKTQGYFPYQAYILGKNWINKSNDTRGDDPFELLGTVDFEGFDNNVICDVANAILWKRNLYENGKHWDPNTPHIPEMYPNACNIHDYPYTKQKQALVEKNKEITSVYRVSVKNRNYALGKGITRWDSKKCTSSQLGINGKVSNTIDKILKINRSTRNIVLPAVISNNLGNWKNVGLDFYVDFETYNDIFDFEYGKISSNLVQMIGVGWIERQKWNYMCFKRDQATLENEQTIFKEFVDFISKKSKNSKPRMIHYTGVEPRLMNRSNIKPNWEWLDLHELLISEPVVIKGALKYGLGDVAGALYKHGCIPTTWNTTHPENGIEAMFNMKHAHKMEDVIRYNEVDCKVMWEIIHYLRSNHI